MIRGSQAHQASLEIGTEAGEPPLALAG
jgi:hypothetical protein